MDRTDLFTAGIFLIGFLSLLLVSFNAMLASRITPIKEDIHRIDSRIDRLDSRIDRLDSRIDQVESRIKTQMDRMNDKLDKLLLLQVQQNANNQRTLPINRKNKPSVKSSATTRPASRTPSSATD